MDTIYEDFESALNGEIKMSFKFNCDTCNNKCDGRSIGVYDFRNDVEYSEYFERMIINDINSRGYYAIKTQRPQYPDIEVYDKEGGALVCFIEIKAQRRTFMSVQKILPNSGLVPSETVALNQSDLEHYISQSRIEQAPIYLAWVLSNRPCITDKEFLIFYNHISELEQIFNQCGDKRRFRRKSGQGDVVNGQHRGVVVNYHFSLNELLTFDLDNILE